MILWATIAVSGSAAALSAAGGGFSLRFFGNGASAPGLDLVDIPLDAPHRPVDVGISDFTIEWWMKANPGENAVATCVDGADGWISGNILIDRDVFGAGDFGDFGISLAGGRIAFGVANGVADGICSNTNVADGQWHHVAAARREIDGQMWLWVDGQLEGTAVGPAGNVSYRDGRSTSFPKDPFLVLGAEKHTGDLSFSGWLDELRLSMSLRYPAANFTPPTAPFIGDGDTAALYHFDEGSGNLVGDSSGAADGPSTGQRQFGGSPAGPLWSTDTPFSGPAGDLIFGDGFDNGNTSSWSSATP